jgi:hypothetical protein
VIDSFCPRVGSGGGGEGQFFWSPPPDTVIFHNDYHDMNTELCQLSLVYPRSELRDWFFCLLVLSSLGGMVVKVILLDNCYPCSPNDLQGLPAQQWYIMLS